MPVATAAVVVTSREANGKTIEELGQDPNTRGVYLESLRRGTELMPREPWTVLERGDILHIVGAPDDVERAWRHIGFVERDLSRTDLTFLAATGVAVGKSLHEAEMLDVARRLMDKARARGDRKSVV